MTPDLRPPQSAGKVREINGTPNVHTDTINTTINTNVVLLLYVCTINTICLDSKARFWYWYLVIVPLEGGFSSKPEHRPSAVQH